MSFNQLDCGFKIINFLHLVSLLLIDCLNFSVFIVTMVTNFLNIQLMICEEIWTIKYCDCIMITINRNSSVDWQNLLKLWSVWMNRWDLRSSTFPSIRKWFHWNADSFGMTMNIIIMISWIICQCFRIFILLCKEKKSNSNRLFIPEKLSWIWLELKWLIRIYIRKVLRQFKLWNVMDLMITWSQVYMFMIIQSSSWNLYKKLSWKSKIHGKWWIRIMDNDHHHDYYPELGNLELTSEYKNYHSIYLIKRLIIQLIIKS